MALSRRARRTLTWTGPAAAAAAVIIALAATGVFGPHRNASSPTPAAPASPVAAPSPSETPSPASAPADLDLHSVNWQQVTLPGETCFSGAPIQLHGGRAVLPATPHDHEVMLNLVFDPSAIVYGPVEGAGTTDAALLVRCSNEGSNASGNLRNTLVVFSGRGATLHVLGVLLPGVQPAGQLPTLMDPPAITVDQLTVQEAFWGPNDTTASPSGRATTVFTWTGSRFNSHTTINRQPATAPPTSSN